MVNVMVDDGGLRKFYSMTQVEMNELFEKNESLGLDIEILEDFQFATASEVLNDFGSLGL